MQPSASLQRIRKQHQQADDRVLSHRRHQEAMLQSIKTQETIVNTVKSLVDYLENHTGKVAVINQLRAVGTPDALKVVDALNELHATLKTHQNTDLSEVTQVLNALLEEARQIPKDHPDIQIPSEVSVSNLPDHSGDFKQLLEAVQAIKLVAEAPVVHVPAPEVHVAPTDLQPIGKGLQAVEKAVKSIVIPEYHTDNSGVEKLLKQANKALADLLDKPAGGGSGGGGLATPYEINGLPAFVQLDNSRVPVAEADLATRLDDTTTANAVYIGKAPIGTAASAAAWQVAKLDTSSGLIKTWADGDASYDNVWDNRAALTYN